MPKQCYNHLCLRVCVCVGARPSSLCIIVFVEGWNEEQGPEVAEVSSSGTDHTDGGLVV
jgi:hypothetical protein